MQPAPGDLCLVGGPPRELEEFQFPAYDGPGHSVRFWLFNVKEGSTVTVLANPDPTDVLVYVLAPGLRTCWMYKSHLVRIDESSFQ